MIPFLSAMFDKQKNRGIVYIPTVKNLLGKFLFDTLQNTCDSTALFNL